MLFSRSSASLSLALLATQVPLVSAQSAGPIELQGCFTNAKGLTFDNSYKWQSQGWCQTQCLKKQKPVMGLTDGGDCWCGDEVPPKSAKTDDFKCSHQCNGYVQACGGPQGTFGVYSTGQSADVQQAQDDPPPVVAGDDTTTSTEQSATTTTASPTETTVPPSVVTVGGGTSVVTIPGSTVTIPPSQQAGAAGPQPTSSDDDDDGPSTGAKVGIALGVIGGVAALAAIIAAVFIMKKKKNDAIINRHRRNTSNNPFANDGSVDGTRNGSMSDSRLDPTMVERERRLSNGSVFADNEDYSRRILKVTNPSDR